MSAFHCDTQTLRRLVRDLIQTDEDPITDLDFISLYGVEHRHVVNIKKWGKRYVDLYIEQRVVLHTENDTSGRPFERPVVQYFLHDRVLPATTRVNFTRLWNKPHPCVCSYIVFESHCPVCDPLVLRKR